MFFNNEVIKIILVVRLIFVLVIINLGDFDNCVLYIRIRKFLIIGDIVNINGVIDVLMKENNGFSNIIYLV